MLNEDTVATAAEAQVLEAPKPEITEAPKTNGAHKPKRKRKAVPKKLVRAAKAKPRKARVYDPAKLDQFGFRKGSDKSKAAAMYAKGNGATLNQVKDAVGSVQFNLLGELEGRGFKIERTQVKGKVRPVTRFKIISKK